MSIFKATMAMFIWSAAVGYGLWYVGVQNHIPAGYMWGHEPMWMSALWLVGAALALLITLMVNVIIFSCIAGDQAWTWLKNK